MRNEHGEEEYEFKIYVTVAGGMDFRAMLMKKKKKKAPPGPPPIEWIEKPVDISVQEKTDPKAMFAARLSEKGKVGKWFLLNQVRKRNICIFKRFSLFFFNDYIYIHTYFSISNNGIKVFYFIL